MQRPWCLLAAFIVALALAGNALALSSPNIPLDSPIYLYLEKLSGYGLIVSDFKGIRPYSSSEAARLLREAEAKLASGGYPPLAQKLVDRLKELMPREASLYGHEEQTPAFDFNPLYNAQLRYVYLDGVPRNYVRTVLDPGGDWTFPLWHFRPRNSSPGPGVQRGSEGTPLFENNEGVIYGDGHNLQARWSSTAYAGSVACALVEPLFLWSSGDDASDVRLNKGYLKLGGGALELEIGRDANWLGPGYRGAITLTDNARNLTSIKLSSPEPVTSRYLWDLKYDLIFSQLDKTTVIPGETRQPYFYAMNLSFKPIRNLEFGFNLGRLAGGPGVDNSMNATLRGMVGATYDDNSKSNAGVQLRFRLPWLRNSEIYGELSGTDRQGVWPKAQSYIAGFFIPRLSADGSNDLRFEWFRGHQILYMSATFPNGYLYHGFPLGDSQGGATQDFFLRYSHWFSARNTVALEGIYTTRGEVGRAPVDAAGHFDPNGTMQAIERLYGMRVFWNLPVYGQWNATLMYGGERVENWGLTSGRDQTNQLVRVDLSYRY